MHTNAINFCTTLLYFYGKNVNERNNQALKLPLNSNQSKNIFSKKRKFSATSAINFFMGHIGEKEFSKRNNIV